MNDGLKRWLEENEAGLRLVYRIALIFVAIWVLLLVRDLHRYRGEPDIRGVAADVGRIERNVSAIRERLDRR